MTIQAQLADGRVLEFPDGTNPAVIQATVKKMIAGQAPAPQRAQPKASGFSGFMANLNRGSYVGDEMAAAFQTPVNIMANLGDARQQISKYGVADYIGASYRNALARQRGVEDRYMQDHPYAANLAKGTGMAATMAAPAGPAANAMVRVAPAGANLATRTAVMGGNALRGAVAGATQGAAYGLADRGRLSERLSAATEGAKVGAVVGGVGNAVLGRVQARQQTGPRVSARTRRQQRVDMLASEGVRLTPGQARGGLSKSLEDAATSLPIVGPAIQDARRVGMEDFGRAVGNRALSHINDALPEGVVGNEAVAYMGERFGQAYDNLLPKGGVTTDAGFKQAVADVGPTIDTLRPESLKQLETIVKSRITSRLQDGRLDGPTYQRVQSELRSEINRFKGSQDPDHRAVADALGGFSRALEDAAMRQNPEFATELANVNRGYAEFKRAQAASGKVGAEEGVYSAAQYDAAVRAGDRSLDKARYAEGGALGQDLARAGRDILPNKIPDSGTATRGGFALGAHAVGGSVGALAGGAPGAALGVAATGGALVAGRMAYSPAAMNAYNMALQKGASRRQVQQAANELRRMAASDPAVQQLYRELVQKISRGATGTNVQQQPTR